MQREDFRREIRHPEWVWMDFLIFTECIFFLVSDVSYFSGVNSVSFRL